jgi:outer membrane biosynthesis protein TonB
MMEVQEEDYRKYGLLGTVIFHALLLLLLIFAIFRGPNPPLEAGGSGVDLQYGIIGDEGFGDNQTTAPPNDSKNTEDSRPAARAPQPAAQPQVVAAQKVDAVEEKVLTSDEESPVSMKAADKPEVKIEQPKEEVKVTPKPAAVYTGKSKAETGTGGAGTSNTPAGNNTGDRPGKVGDMGAPNGSMTGKVYTGNPGAGGPGPGGSGGGATLNMNGWRYDVSPKKDPYENESGRVVFRITIDANGEIESVNRIESTVSPQVEKWYRDQIYKTSFSRTSARTSQDQGATGTITIIIRAR